MGWKNQNTNSKLVWLNLKHFLNSKLFLWFSLILQFLELDVHCDLFISSTVNLDKCETSNLTCKGDFKNDFISIRTMFEFILGDNLSSDLNVDSSSCMVHVHTCFKIHSFVLLCQISDHFWCTMFLSIFVYNYIFFVFRILWIIYSSFPKNYHKKFHN